MYILVYFVYYKLIFNMIKYTLAVYHHYYNGNAYGEKKLQPYTIYLIIAIIGNDTLVKEVHMQFKKYLNVKFCNMNYLNALFKLL